MPIHFRHPRLDRLAKFGTASDWDRQRIARHVRDCHRCQRDLRFIRRVEQAAPDVLNVELPSGILDRAMKSRAAGVRIIAPAALSEVPRTRQMSRPLLVAAALVVVIALAIFSTRNNTVAAESESTLVIKPALPRAGDRVKVEYHPAVVSFAHASRLTLRGRLHTTKTAPYGGGITAQSLGTLSPDGDGVFRGSFILPDSVVYVALAVEDSSAATVDTRDGRLWDVVVHDSNGKATFDALDQRENDLMGRSWEEAYATARLNVQLHPQLLAAWNELQFFERELLGERAADSLAKGRSQVLREIINRYKDASDVPASELGTLVWWSYADKDTSTLAYWYGRLARTDPHHPQVAQIAAVQLYDRYWSTAPRLLMDSLEVLWPRVAPVYGPGTYIISTGQQVARKVGDGKAYQRWVDRAYGKDSLARTGFALASFAATREEGMRRIRAALNTPLVDLQRDRPLTANQSEYARVIADRRRELLATLGEALIAAGKRREGLDTLSIAVSDGWDLQLLNRVAAQRLEAGDTTGWLKVEARISVDPRTSQPHIDNITRLAASRLGTVYWSNARATAEREMVRETLSRSILRTIRGDPTAMNDAGQKQSLKESTAGKPSVIVYWSRHCAPALAALPAIDSVGRVLQSEGVPVYLVADEAPSAGTSSFFREHRIHIPVLYDSRKEINIALRNFGTPAYYVLDGAGRVRFKYAQEVNDILLQIRAIQESPNSP
jgi:hypothetical protein